MFEVSVEETFSAGHALRGYKDVLRGIIAGLDHQFMNDLEPFKTVNPSAENLAKYFYDGVERELKDLPPGARLRDVVLWETETSRAQYRPS